MFLITSFLSVVLLIIWNFPQQMETKKPSITFTKIECIDFNKENLEITSCLLYDLKANVQAINMYIDIKNKSRNQIMVKNFKFLLKKYIKIFPKLQIHGQLLHKFRNDYRPFLYNDLVDYCDFIKSSKRHLLWHFIYETTKKFSNLNHTCPINVS